MARLKLDGPGGYIGAGVVLGAALGATLLATLGDDPSKWASPDQRNDWLGFWGGAVGGLMTLVAAVVAWGAMREASDRDDRRDRRKEDDARELIGRRLARTFHSFAKAAAAMAKTYEPGVVGTEDERVLYLAAAIELLAVFPLPAHDDIAAELPRSEREDTRQLFETMEEFGIFVALLRRVINEFGMERRADLVMAIANYRAVMKYFLFDINAKASATAYRLPSIVDGLQEMTAVERITAALQLRSILDHSTASPAANSGPKSCRVTSAQSNQ